MLTEKVFEKIVIALLLISFMLTSAMNFFLLLLFIRDTNFSESLKRNYLLVYSVSYILHNKTGNSMKQIIFSYISLFEPVYGENVLQKLHACSG